MNTWQILTILYGKLEHPRSIVPIDATIDRYQRI